MKFNRKNMSLKQRSSVLVAGMALVLLVAYSVFSIYYVELETRRLLDARLLHAKAVADDLDKRLSRASSKIAEVVKLPALREGLQAQDENRKGRVISAAETLHYMFYLSDEFAGGVFLVDKGGKILWHEPPDLSLVDSVLPSFPEIRRAIDAHPDNDHVMTVTENHKVHSPSGKAESGSQILIAAPIGLEGGALIGAIPTRHPTAIQAALEKDTTGNLQLVSPSRMVIASTERSRNLRPLSYANAVKDFTTANTLRNVNGSVVAVAPMEANPGWAITIDQERSMVLAESRKVQLILAIFGLILVLLATSVLFFILRSFTRPVELLTADARRIAAGDLDVQFTTGREDEIGILASTLDEMKSRLKASYERLLVGEKMGLMGQVVSGIAHELNNPLTIVVGYTELLMTTQQDEKLKASLTRIHDGAQRASKIVRNLLTFARQQKPERKITDVNSVLLKTIDLRAYELRVSNIELVTELAPVPRTMTDPHQLQQVFLNLIMNAEHAMLETNGRGRLAIKSSVKGGHIEILFEDDGPGISEENLRKIFDPFFTTKSVGKGTGLGLSICQGIVAEHGGRLNAASTPGCGARFVVELPIVAVFVKEAPAVVEIPKDGSRKRILVVEDESHLREMFQEILRSDGHFTETASSGKEAMDLVHDHEFDLVISDIKMPETDGREFYRMLKSEGSPLANRLIFVTGDLMNPETLKFLQSTGAPWIAKPFDVSAALQTINSVLTSKAS
jgi:signal transduction histidine kinase/ActR/RegA family two-component response regulator